MKTTRSLLLPVALVAALATVAGAQLPEETMAAAGVVKDAVGDPAVGPVNLRFFLYDELLVGSLLWTEQHTGVPLDAAGAFHVTLGATTPLAPGFFTDPNIWFTLEVNGDGEMSPRIPLGKVPTAFNADLLDGSPPTTFAPRAELSDQDPLTTPVHWGDLDAVPAGFADGTDDVDDADNDPANELLTGAQLLGTTLHLDDAGGTRMVDLASLRIHSPSGAAGGDLTGTYPAPQLAPNAVGSAEIQDGTIRLADLGTNSVDSSKIANGSVQAIDLAPAGFADGIDDVDDADSSPTNELNSSVVLNGTSLEVTDAGGTQSADLVSLTGGVTLEPFRVTGSGIFWTHPTMGWTVRWDASANTVTVTNDPPTTGFCDVTIAGINGQTPNPGMTVVEDITDLQAVSLALDFEGDIFLHGFTIVCHDETANNGFVMQASIYNANVGGLVQYW